MTALVSHLVKGLVSRPDQVTVNTVEGEASVLLELTVAPEDIARVKGPDGETLRSIRTVISAAAGDRKAILELVEPRSAAAEE
ncbi:MAG: KH domain-containing protein [Myxococcota bacterium]